MLPHKKQYYTPEEYLTLEEAADYKNEYYQGEIFAMSGSSVNHNRIAKNTVVALEAAFGDKPCETFIGDVRLWVKKNGLYTYPDVMVVCGPIEFAKNRTDTLTNPVVIVEVLSKSTQNYDRGGKFALYRALESFQDYILIEQDKVYVEHFYRLDDGRWILQEFNQLEDVLILESIEVKLPLQQICYSER